MDSKKKSCPACGSEVESNLSRCPNCGSPLGSLSPSTNFTGSESSVVSSDARADNLEKIDDEEAASSTVTGQPIPYSGYDRLSPQEPIKHKASPVIITVVVLVVVCCLAVLGAGVLLAAMNNMFQ